MSLSSGYPERYQSLKSLFKHALFMYPRVIKGVWLPILLWVLVKNSAFALSSFVALSWLKIPVDALLAVVFVFLLGMVFHRLHQSLLQQSQAGIADLLREDFSAMVRCWVPLYVSVVAYVLAIVAGYYLGVWLGSLFQAKVGHSLILAYLYGVSIAFPLFFVVVVGIYAPISVMKAEASVWMKCLKGLSVGYFHWSKGLYFVLGLVVMYVLLSPITQQGQWLWAHYLSIPSDFVLTAVLGVVVATWGLLIFDNCSRYSKHD